MKIETIDGIIDVDLSKVTLNDVCASLPRFLLMLV